MNELLYGEGNIGLDGDAADGEGGTLVEPGRLSGDVDAPRVVPELDRGRRVALSGEVRVKSRSPYKDVGRRLGGSAEGSGELGAEVCVVVPERAEFSDDTDEPVDVALMLSRVFERRKRAVGV